MTGLGSTYASVESVEKMNANLELYLSRSSSEYGKDYSVCISSYIFMCLCWDKCPQPLTNNAGMSCVFWQT